MEKISKTDGVYYYGNIRCMDEHDAYRRFRDDYNRSLGAAVHLRLNRIGSRQERVHGFGFFFADKAYVRRLEDEFASFPKVPYRIIGFLSVSPVRMIRDIPEFDDEEKLYRWVDWICMSGNDKLYITGRKRNVRKKRFKR